MANGPSHTPGSTTLMISSSTPAQSRSSAAEPLTSYPGVGVQKTWPPPRPSHVSSLVSAKDVWSVHTHANQWPNMTIATMHLLIACMPCEMGSRLCHRLKRREARSSRTILMQRTSRMTRSRLSCVTSLLQPLV